MIIEKERRKTRMISIRVEEELYQQFRRRARQDNSDVAKTVRYLMKLFIAGEHGKSELDTMILKQFRISDITPEVWRKDVKFITAQFSPEEELGEGKGFITFQEVEGKMKLVDYCFE